MSILASLLSIALFLAFGSIGAQKIVFNPTMSKAADHLGFTKRGYQSIGVIEVLGAIALLVGLASTRSSILGIINEVAAGGFAAMMLVAVIAHLRKGDRLKGIAPALIFGVLSLLALICRAA